MRNNIRYYTIILTIVNQKLIKKQAALDNRHGLSWQSWLYHKKFTKISWIEIWILNLFIIPSDISPTDYHLFVKNVIVALEEFLTKPWNFIKMEYISWNLNGKRLLKQIACIFIK